jgi:alkylation response protein AidB-like acyl-CoA dehydrogenase
MPTAIAHAPVAATPVAALNNSPSATNACAPPSASVAPHYLRTERALLERFMPGLDEALKAIPLAELEDRQNPGIKLFKDAKGPALLIPARYGGMGATAPEGARVLRAIGSRAPSLGIVCTMHNFSVSTLVEWAIFGEEYGEALLSGLAADSLYVASGFAEGRTGARPLDMTMKARRAPGGGWLISGKKKPCTLSHSMDFLSCGVVAETEPGVWRRAVGLIPADSEGIERKPFWKSHILAGAESDEVIVTDVHVPDDFVFAVDASDALDPVEVTGYIWLQVALCSTYLGMVSSLVERLLASGKGTPEERGMLVAQTESLAAAIDGIAYALDSRKENQKALLCRSLSMRIAAQGSIEQIAMRAAELLGGMAFINSPEVAYLLCACRAMAFHPPGRLFAVTALDEYARGGTLDVT